MYCTEPEVLDMIKDDMINSILGDGYIEDLEERRDRILPLVTAAIGDACAEIDGYLAKRYPVPMVPTPGVISKFAKDMAVYNLVSRRGLDEDEREKNYLTRYNAAVKFFTLVAEGKVDIGTGGLDGGGGSSASGFKMSSPPRIFSRDKLQGM